MGKLKSGLFFVGMVWASYAVLTFANKALGGRLPLAPR
jgi:hypothetical protein